MIERMYTLEEAVNTAKVLLEKYLTEYQMMNQEDPETFPLERTEQEWLNTIATYLTYPQDQHLKEKPLHSSLQGRGGVSSLQGCTALDCLLKARRSPFKGFPAGSAFGTQL